MTTKAKSLVGVCHHCREIVQATPGAVWAPDNASAEERAKIEFSSTFGMHVQTRHPEVMRDFQAVAMRAGMLGAEVAGWLALGMAESTDPEFKAWREADRERITKGLEEMLAILRPAN